MFGAMLYRNFKRLSVFLSDHLKSSNILRTNRNFNIYLFPCSYLRGNILCLQGRK